MHRGPTEEALRAPRASDYEPPAWRVDGAPVRRAPRRPRSRLDLLCQLRVRLQPLVDAPYGRADDLARLRFDGAVPPFGGLELLFSSASEDIR
ncbi:MAG: hypothetical protein AMJ63_16730 [Myxococcales bacterium SG8_38_1]|nr:MAG: hypothetical protein AMJ63_16730 [Myxococcales bacterium SG8_38_1]